MGRPAAEEELEEADRVGEVDLPVGLPVGERDVAASGRRAVPAGEPLGAADAARFLLIEAAPPLLCTDANDSGKLDPNHVDFLLCRIFLGGQPPPPPFALPGRDTTGESCGAC